MRVRSNIRSLIFTAIQDGTSGVKVTIDRATPYRLTELPLVNVRTPADQQHGAGVMDSSNSPRILAVDVEIITDGATAFDDADDIAVAVEKLVLGDTALRSWTLDLFLAGTSVDYDEDEDLVVKTTQHWESLILPFADAGPKPGEDYDTTPGEA